ncbi:MAG TPA: glycosyltransferase family 4 protein [Solirubrobacteraceae bacterium]|jgi:glycosyltransferase involved in cell wall biosynthesis
MRLLAYTDSQAVGGAELALGYLLRALAPEIEVGLLVSDPEVGEMLATYRPQAPLSIVPAPAGLDDRAALLAHLRAIRAHAPDILHANQAWPWACGYGELAALLTPGVRVLAVDHLPIGGAVPRRRILARRLLARRLHAHVSVGERSARAVEEIIGLRAGSVGAVPNGVPRWHGESLPPALAAGSSFASAAGPIVGSVGRLTDQKGYDLLIRALPELPGARLVLVGDGPQRGALERLAAQLGVAERLLITGWIADARAHLPGFDVFALPSRWEGMPLGIIEAMHAALPVLACDVGSVVEAVRDGESGFVVGADDLPALQARLATLLADPQLRRRMGERGRSLATENFTDTVMARRYEAIYYEMIGPVARTRGRASARGGP